MNHLSSCGMLRRVKSVFIVKIRFWILSYYITIMQKYSKLLHININTMEIPWLYFIIEKRLAHTGFALYFMMRLITFQTVYRQRHNPLIISNI